MKAIFCALAMAAMSGVTCIGFAVAYESLPEKYHTTAVGGSVLVAGYVIFLALLIAAANVYDSMKGHG